MIRKSTLLLCAIMTLALPVAAQNRQANSVQNMPPASQVFLGAFQAIRDYGLMAHGDSTLWDKALEGLLAELDDP